MKLFNLIRASQILSFRRYNWFSHAEIDIDGKTHFSASSNEEWYNCLDKLLSNKKLCEQMGSNGRDFSLQNFLLDKQVEKLSQTFIDVVNQKNKANE